jgi:L-aspartate oxidase
VSTASAPAQGGPVVVVGGGIAGLTTALALAPIPSVVLTGGPLATQTSSVRAQGGIAAAVGDDDDPGRHAHDTVAAGTGLCDPDAVRAITAAAPGTIAWLAGLGVRFDRHADGALHCGLEGAHSRRRIVHADGDGTGREIVRALVDAVRREPAVTVLDHARALRIRTDDDGAVRAVLVERDGVVAELATRRVVLATGGIGGLYLGTTTPLASRGQGLALALRAGAAVRDVEMVQLHPTALDVGLDPMPLVSEAVRGAGARLVTADGLDVLDDPLAPRDVVARAVDATLRAGRQVYLDAREALGGTFAAHFPTVAAACVQSGIDPATDLVPVRPAAHYHMGGVAVDLRGRTSVAGLWACGEVASTGLHGANRLASNSLLEAVVTGRWVAADIAGGAGPAGTPSGAATPSGAGAGERAVGAGPSSTGGRRDTGQAAPWLRRLMADAAGVLRDGGTLARAVARLEAEVARTGTDDADDDVLVALAVCRAALLRTESRGAHTRTDHRGSEPPRHLVLTLDDVVAHAVPALAVRG